LWDRSLAIGGALPASTASKGIFVGARNPERPGPAESRLEQRALRAGGM